MNKKIRCIVISEDEWKSLPYDLANKFNIAKKDDFTVYMGCMSSYLIKKTQSLLK